MNIDEKTYQAAIQITSQSFLGGLFKTLPPEEVLRLCASALGVVSKAAPIVAEGIPATKLAHLNAMRETISAVQPKLAEGLPPPTEEWSEAVEFLWDFVLKSLEPSWLLVLAQSACFAIRAPENLPDPSARQLLSRASPELRQHASEAYDLFQSEALKYQAKMNPRVRLVPG
jgi:hypothetical protein